MQQDVLAEESATTATCGANAADVFLQHMLESAAADLPQADLL